MSTGVLLYCSNTPTYDYHRVAERCVEKLISVSDNAHPAIRDQAKAFQKHMEKVVAFYMREAIRSDRTTVYNALKDAGHEELADAIRRL